MLMTYRLDRRSPLCRGFTIIELLVVLAAIGLLLGIVAPRYVEHVDRARETVLRQNLAGLRSAIDQFRGDRDRWPVDLQELVRERYLRQLPLDPITNRSDTWVQLAPRSAAKGAVLVTEPAAGAAGVGDVRSGAPGVSRDGSAYATW